MILSEASHIAFSGGSCLPLVDIAINFPKNFCFVNYLMNGNL
jgi:hypothetical protein